MFKNWHFFDPLKLFSEICILFLFTFILLYFIPLQRLDFIDPLTGNILAEKILHLIIHNYKKKETLMKLLKCVSKEIVRWDES